MWLKLDRVCVRLHRREVLSALSACFHSGEVTALTGPSGAGKSTVLGVIAGAVPVESGHISHSAAELTETEWLMQVTPLLQRRSVIDNVLLSQRIRGAGTPPDLIRGVRALQDVGILHLARVPVHLLSGGEKQRVAVARALAGGAPVLLADEPTAALDATNRELVWHSLSVAASAGVMVILATHDASLATRAHHVLHLMDGKLTESGNFHAP